MKLAEFKKIRLAFGSTNVKFAKALQLSTATVYKLGYDEPISRQLREKYADRLRTLSQKLVAGDVPTAASPDETVDVDTEALRHYNDITRAATALYRMAKAGNSSARRSAGARGVPATLAGHMVASLAGDALRQRNAARAAQRPQIASLAALLATAAATQDFTTYHSILDKVTAPGEHVRAFVVAAAQRIVPADDPLVTLPPEMP